MYIEARHFYTTKIDNITGLLYTFYIFFEHTADSFFVWTG